MLNRRLGTAVVATMLLAGCSGSKGLSLGDFTPEPAPAASVEMAGRWMVSAPDAPPCGMTFSGDTAKGEGKISPEGGCPGQFYKSRGWALVQDTLVIKDHTGDALVSLTLQGDRFVGTAPGGIPITLSR